MAYINKYCHPLNTHKLTHLQCVCVLSFFSMWFVSRGVDVCTHCLPVAVAAGVAVADWQLLRRAPSRHLPLHHQYQLLLLLPLVVLLHHHHLLLLLPALRCGHQQGGWSDAPYPRNTHFLLGRDGDIFIPNGPKITNKYMFVCLFFLIFKQQFIGSSISGYISGERRTL